jgi:hypothetical protein
VCAAALDVDAVLRLDAEEAVGGEGWRAVQKKLRFLVVVGSSILFGARVD